MTDLIAALETPVARSGTGQVSKGMAVPRVDGHAKVTGTADYAADIAPAGMLHGVVVCSTIAKGQILRIDTSAALEVPGVVGVVTHENRPRMRNLSVFYKDMTAPGGTPFKPLHDAEVHYSGQPVAVVVADTFEAARHAASLVTVDYSHAHHETSLLDNLHKGRRPSRLKAGYVPPPKEKGDFEAAYAAAPVKMSGEFYSGTEHHNPMEMFATTVVREPDGHFTIYDKTQSSQNSRWYVSRVFGISGDDVTVRNPYVGGAFGSGLRPQYQLPLAVMCALCFERSVRVVLTRQQMFTIGHRPETFQTVKLAAERDGTLVAIHHEAIAETSRHEDYVEVIVNWSGQIYACDNIELAYKVVPLDQYSPIDMRAPGAAHGVHALEVAVDELTYELGMDPLAFRLKNYAETNPQDGKPYSTKALRQCYALGAEKFGWAGRPQAPRSMRDGNEWVGWGMATGQWDAMQMFARASAVLHADGRLVVSSAATDIGTGTYTVMAQIAAAAMGMPMEHVAFQLGDSTLPVAPIEGGSSHVTTVGSAVEGACEKLQKRLFVMAHKLKGSPFSRVRFGDVAFADGALRLASDPRVALSYVDLLAAAGEPRVEVKYLLLPNVMKQRKFVRATHSAIFCEVRVDEELGTLRVTRVVNAVAAGRIMNAQTARSQVQGGVVWGISQALHEDTLADHALGRFMNHNFAEYHVSANADIAAIDVIFADEDDRVVSRLGAKGVGEIGFVGVAAAVANALYHATGNRVRSTPITPDKIMAPRVR